MAAERQIEQSEDHLDEIFNLSVSAAVQPTPATHAIFTKLKAGESVFPTFLLAKTVFYALRGAQPLFHALFWRRNTVWDTSRPAFKEAGLRG